MYYREPEDDKPYNFEASVAAPGIPGVPKVPGSSVPTSTATTDMQRGAQLTKDMAGLASVAGGGNSQVDQAAKATDTAAKWVGTAATIAAMFSDERTKRPVYSDMDAKRAVPVGPDAGGAELQMTPQGRAFYADLQEQPQASVPRASFSGPSNVSKAPAQVAPKAKASATKAEPRKISYKELEDEAAKMMAQFSAPQGPSAVQPLLERTARYEEAPMFSDERAKKEAERQAYAVGRMHQAIATRRGIGVEAYGVNPSNGVDLDDQHAKMVSDVDDAGRHGAEMDAADRPKPEPTRKVDGQPGLVARSGGAAGRIGSSAALASARRAMAPSAYTYKDEFRPPEQKPGEVNIGPMAQSMAADPVARTAVKQDPQSGMLAIDRDKALKLVMGSLADLQSEMDRRRR